MNESPQKNMREFSGPGYTVERVIIEDPQLPRILIVGDSISVGYRSFITEKYQGKAYVDYWFGGAWFDGPESVLGDDSPVKNAWKGVLQHGPYNIITWNPMGLHMWNPEVQAERTPEDKYLQIIVELLKHILSIVPSRTKLIWISTTPFCVINKAEVDYEKSRFVTAFNALSSAIMKENRIPEVDLWAICEKNLDMINPDGVHWSKKAYQLMAGELISEIDKQLSSLR